MAAIETSRYAHEPNQYKEMGPVKTASSIVTEIDDLLRDIWKHISDPENLSTDILKLAVLNGGLGNWLAEAQDIERKAEVDYKHRVDEYKLGFVKDGDSATVAETKAKLAHHDVMQDWLTAQHNATVLKLKRHDTDSAIDAARSRLSLIKGDIRNQQ